MGRRDWEGGTAILCSVCKGKKEKCISVGGHDRHTAHRIAARAAAQAAVVRRGSVAGLFPPFQPSRALWVAG